MRPKTVTSASIGVNTHSFILYSNLHGADIQAIKPTLIHVLYCMLKLSTLLFGTNTRLVISCTMLVAILLAGLN